MTSRRRYVPDFATSGCRAQASRPRPRAPLGCRQARRTDHARQSRSGHAQWPGRWGRRGTPGREESWGAGAEREVGGSSWPSQGSCWQPREAEQVGSPRGPGRDEQWHRSRWPWGSGPWIAGEWGAVQTVPRRTPTGRKLVSNSPPRQAWMDLGVTGGLWPTEPWLWPLGAWSTLCFALPFTQPWKGPDGKEFTKPWRRFLQTPPFHNLGGSLAALLKNTEGSPSWRCKIFQGAWEWSWGHQNC